MELKNKILFPYTLLGSKFIGSFSTSYSFAPPVIRLVPWAPGYGKYYIDTLPKHWFFG